MRSDSARAGTLVLAVLLQFAAAGAHAAARGQAGGAAPATVRALGVDELMKAPENRPEPLLVEGVVKSVSEKDHALALIDVEEYRRCRMVTCSLLSLPVQWTGGMPRVLDVVRVEGRIAVVAGQMLFVAGTLEKVPDKRQE